MTWQIYGSDGEVSILERPRLTAPGVDDHKYTRGFVTILGGMMPGAAALATLAAARAGAGYVQLCAPERIDGLPFAIVQRTGLDAQALAQLLDDARIDAVVVGMGLGRDDDAKTIVEAAIASGRPLVLDADALPHVRWPLDRPAILTPHAGEFARSFPDLALGSPRVDGPRLQAALAAARRSGAAVILKGSQTMIAGPNGRTAAAPAASAGLATAGTGDVLAGMCGTMLAQLRDPFAAACAAVWLHARAARDRPIPFIADDLVGGISAAVAECLTAS